MEPRPKFFNDFSRACMHVRAMQGPSGDGGNKYRRGNVRFGWWSQSGRRNTLSLTDEMEWMAIDRGTVRGFNAAAKAQLWDRWRRGESLKATERAFGKPSSSIYFQVAPYGGIRPAPRHRSRLALTLSEREEISRKSFGSNWSALIPRKRSHPFFYGRV